ncbi:hypothetical protein [Streptomyces microflavus]|uniref:hypothetical protein n=1 Tax=Streptomyces microflavus TaxID=1919 RepID=UPI00368BBDA3
MTATANERLSAVTAAAVVFADTFESGLTAEHVAPSLTCAEVDALSAVLAETGHREAAARWIAAHGGQDDEECDTHHEVDPDEYVATWLIS